MTFDPYELKKLFFGFYNKDFFGIREQILYYEEKLL